MERCGQGIEPWVLQDLGDAQFGDARLTARAVALASQLCTQPDVSIASAYQGDWAGLKAAYRFFDNPAVDPAALLDAHRKAMWARRIPHSWILIAQDTTTLNFTGHPSTEGLGPIEYRWDRGLFVHSALAMTAEGVPLGIAAQKVWVRDLAEYGKSARRETLPIEQKESYRWLETARAAMGGLPADSEAVIIGDRESDIYELFVMATEEHRHILVRGSWNRHLYKHPARQLWPAAEEAPVIGTSVIEVPRKPGQSVRSATLELRATTVTLMRPHGKRRAGRDPIPMQVVLAREVEAPTDARPIEWLLLTTLPVASATDAARLVRWYTYRWRIERFHYTLKTGGCHVERLQLSTLDRLTRAITLYSIIAWHILWLTYQVRLDPQHDCSGVFSPLEIAVLRRLVLHQRPRQGPRAAPRDQEPPLTLHDALHAIAKLGGFIGRRHDGDPGVKTLWRGYRQLQWILWGIAQAPSLRD